MNGGYPADQRLGLLLVRDLKMGFRRSKQNADMDFHAFRYEEFDRTDTGCSLRLVRGQPEDIKMPEDRVENRSG